jgi:PBP1b-binding outer membrane lipoprotein LpoB
MKKTMIAALMAVVIFSGCAANQKSSSESSKTTKTVCNENSKTPSSATEDDDPRWIDANFFNSKIANITYYFGEDKVNIDPESKTGKRYFLSSRKDLERMKLCHRLT